MGGRGEQLCPVRDAACVNPAVVGVRRCQQWGCAVCSEQPLPWAQGQACSRAAGHRSRNPT